MEIASLCASRYHSRTIRTKVIQQENKNDVINTDTSNWKIRQTFNSNDKMALATQIYSRLSIAHLHVI